MATETIYIELLDEGSPTWRPAEAEVLGHGKYRVLRPDHYDPEDEVWEFIPGTVVRCAMRSLSDGEVLVAYERVE